MLSPDLLLELDPDAVIGQYQGLDLKLPEDQAVLAGLIGGRLRQLGRYALLADNYVEVGMTISGTAAETGDASDEGMTALVHLGKVIFPRAPKMSWIKACVTLDDGQGPDGRIEHLGFLCYLNGEKELDFVTMAQTEPFYKNLHGQIEGGYFAGPLRHPRNALEPDKAKYLTRQAIRILTHCQVDDGRTQVFTQKKRLDKRNRRNDVHTLRPVA